MSQQGDDAAEQCVSPLKPVLSRPEGAVAMGSTQFFTSLSVVSNVGAAIALAFLAWQPVAYSWCILPFSPPDNVLLVCAALPIVNLLILFLDVRPSRALYRMMRLLNALVATFGSLFAGAIARALYTLNGDQFAATWLGLTLIITMPALAFNPTMDHRRPTEEK